MAQLVTLARPELDSEIIAIAAMPEILVKDDYENDIKQSELSQC